MSLFTNLRIRTNVNRLEHPSKREFAIDNLVAIGEPAVDPLIAVLEDRSKGPWAAKALARIGDERAVFPLLHKLDVEDRSRVLYIEALGELRHPDAISGLVRMLQTWWDSGTRRSAADALACLGPAAHGALLGVMQDPVSNNFETRHWAAYALKKAGWKAPTAVLAVECAVLLSDWDTCVSISGDAVAPLIDALDRGIPPAAERGIVECLAKIGDARAAAPAAAVLERSTDDQTALAAIRGLKTFARPCGMGALRKALESRNTDVRLAALGALAALGPSQPVVEALRYALEDQNMYVRRAATKALGALGAADMVLPHLVAALNNSDSGVRQSAVEGLAACGAQTAVLEALVTALADRIAEVARLAARTLHSLRWTPSGPAEEALRRIALREFGGCIALGSAAVQPLLDALARFGTDYAWKTERKQIVTVLGKLADRRAIPALTEASKRDDSPGVRRRAKRSTEWIDAGAH